MSFLRGTRDKLSKYVNVNEEICVEMLISGSAEYDFCCFGVDKQSKLSNESYMIFYNQLVSPQGEIELVRDSNMAKFKIHLSRLPQEIDKLVFTVSIDGNGTMGEINEHSISVIQHQKAPITMTLLGQDFSQEKAIISIEIYRKDEWRIAAVGSGFNGGLSALLASYGGNEIKEEVNDQVASIQPKPSLKDEQELAQKVMNKISLSKDKVNLEKHVVNLSKCVVDLSKKSGVNLGETRAKVVVVLDYSASMSKLYSKGTVQSTLNRLVPLGLTFDDNGAIEVYLFQNDYRKMDDLNLSNYEHYVNDVIMKSDYRMGGTNYAPVLKAIIKGGKTYKQTGFLGFGKKTVLTTAAIVDDGDPTFILFITDGENSDRQQTNEIIRKASEMNFFIQFIGIGSQRFNYLMKLDEMKGRKRDNTGFSKMQDLDQADDQELYAKVLEQFAGWLKGLQ